MSSQRQRVGFVEGGGMPLGHGYIVQVCIDRGHGCSNRLLWERQMICSRGLARDGNQRPAGVEGAEGVPCRRTPPPPQPDKGDNTPWHAMVGMLWDISEPRRNQPRQAARGCRHGRASWAGWYREWTTGVARLWMTSRAVHLSAGGLSHARRWRWGYGDMAQITRPWRNIAMARCNCNSTALCSVAAADET